MIVENQIKHNGRTVAQKETFQVEGTFESLYAAQRWLSDNGYDYGSNCAMMPTPVMKGKYEDYDLPLKWKNFSEAQKNEVDGVMVGDFREGPVTVYIFKQTK